MQTSIPRTSRVIRKIQGRPLLTHGEILDIETGDLENTTFIELDENDPNEYLIIKARSPRKTVEPFHFICRNTKLRENLNKGERLLFHDICEFIGYQNNFLFHPDTKGMPFTIKTLTEYLDQDSSTISTNLNGLEQKGYIKLVKLGTSKYIYIYSKYAWRGKTSNQNDLVLQDFIAKFCQEDK